MRALRSSPASSRGPKGDTNFSVALNRSSVANVNPHRLIDLDQGETAKLRRTLDANVFLEALRDYRCKHRAGMDELWYFADICRVARVIRLYLEAVHYPAQTDYRGKL